MYVKIRQDGALGIGRATEGAGEITLGYGEAHMIAAALDKLAQTARSYKQTYHKTTDVGGGNRIEFERSDHGTIIISGDRNTYICTEDEVRVLAEKLKHLPPVSVMPPSDYVKKITPDNGLCLAITNGGNSIKIRLPEAALLKTAIQSSINSRYYDEPIVVGQRVLHARRSSDLKWDVSDGATTIRFTAYEIEAFVTGLHNGILDVLMDVVKSFGSDDISDIRVKSLVQRIEQDTTVMFAEAKNGKSITKDLVKRTKKILGINELADERANRFIDLCRHIYGEMDTAHFERLFDLVSDVFVAK